jgi:uncharacterized protein YheU (UPF0270 family)
VGCSDFTETSPARKTTRTAVSITLPPDVTLKPGGGADTPGPRGAATISAIHLSVTADDIDTINEDIPLDTLELTLDITSGTARTFTVTLDTDSDTIYSGSTTVDLDPGANITVNITVVAVDITAAPTGLSATAGIVEVSLSWDSTTDATSYNIYWNETGDVAKTDNAITELTGTTYTHTGLTGDTTYYYAVSASNAAGESELSAEVSATPEIFDETAPTTTASPAGGTVHYYPSITLTCDDGTGVGCANTYFTTDETEPTTSSTLYESAIYISADTTLKFFSIDLRGYTESAKTETYTIDLPPTTSASHPSDLYNASIDVTLTCTDTSGTGCDATYYTTDGTEPTTASSLYSSAITISSDTTLAFFSTDTSGESGPTYYKYYTFDTTSPSVTSTYPNNNQKLFPTGRYGDWVQDISIFFSEDMLHSTIDTSTITFDPSIAGDVTNELSGGANITTFIPTENLQEKTNYTATVSQAVKDLAGNQLWSTAASIISDYVWNFTTGGWTYPADTTEKINAGTTPTSSPQVAMADNGDAIVVWVQEDNTVNCGTGCNQIYASIYKNGSWTHPATLASPLSIINNQHASQPQVAMDNNGKATVVWRQSNGTNQTIYKIEYDADWGTASAISPASGAGNPQVAMNDNGKTIITWEQFDGFYNQIFMVDYNIEFTNAWSTVSGITDNISLDSPAINSHVAINNNDRAVITWEQIDGTGNCVGSSPCAQIYKRDYNITSVDTWSTISSLTDNISPDNYHAINPQVSMDNLGNALIVWQQKDGTTNCGGTPGCDQIFKSEYRDGDWTNPSSLANNISPNGEDAQAPQVAMGSNGDAIIVWNQLDGPYNQVFKSEYRSGSWTHPSSTTDNISVAGFDSYFPRVAMNDNGHALITWYQFGSAAYQIFKSEFRGGVWNHPLDNLDNPTSPNGTVAKNAEVAIDSSGRTIITFLQTAAVDQVFISEYR